VFSALRAILLVTAVSWAQPAAALTMNRAPDWVLAKVNSALKGNIRAGSITFDGTKGLVLHGAELTAPNGRLVLTAKRIQVKVDLLDLLKEVIQIRKLSISGVSVKMEQNARGGFDLLDALAPTAPSGPSSGGVSIQKLNIADVTFRMITKDQRLTIKKLHLQGRLAAIDGNTSGLLRLSTGAIRFRLPGRGPATLDLKVFGAELGHIELDASLIAVSRASLKLTERQPPLSASAQAPRPQPQR
jgi:hypothetical protein